MNRVTDDAAHGIGFIRHMSAPAGDCAAAGYKDDTLLNETTLRSPSEAPLAKSLNIESADCGHLKKND